MLIRHNYFLLSICLSFSLAVKCKEDDQSSLDIREDQDIQQVKPSSCGSKRKKKNCKKNERCELDFELIYGTSIPNPYGIFPSISKHGDQVFLLYVNFQNDFPPITIKTNRAQLFKNVNGHLEVTHTLPFDANRPVVWEGFASPDFAKFSVLSTTDENVDFLRIDLYTVGPDSTFQHFGHREFYDIYGESVVGGTFSEDGHYVLFGYVDASDDANPFTRMFVFDARDHALRTVASATIEQFPGYNPNTMLFTLIDDDGHKNLYFTYTSNGQYYGEGDASEPPFFSQVFKVDVDAGTIKLVAKVGLPQYSEVNVYVQEDKKTAIIMHGGQCTINPQAPNIYTVINKGMIGQLPPDYNTIRLFRFSVEDEKLDQILAQPTECCSFIAAYPPDNGLSYLIGQSTTVFRIPGDPATLGPTPQEYYAGFRIKDGPTGLVLRPENGPFEDLKIAGTVFSQDGKWLLRVGQFGYLTPERPNIDSIGIKNILLFKVLKNRYKPVCDL